MILEVAILYIKPGLYSAFETDFKNAGQYIRSIPGYRHHSLKKCLEDINKYILLVEWDKLEDHTVGFRQSEVYLQWKELLHHYYDPFPVVEHFKEIEL
jgi:heme-degrading monooxygenase HmoA